ncbi:MAG: hypothetical protein KA754_02030 [Corallincola sp.]|nr:hypothetical protein [Corallincola sp.]
MYSQAEGMLHSLRLVAGLSLLAASGTALATSASIADIQLVEGEAVVELNGSKFGAGPKVAFFDDFEAGDEGAALGSAPIRVGAMSVNRPPVYVAYGTDRADTGILIRDRSLATNLQMLQAAVEFPQTNEAFIHYTVHVPPGNGWPFVTSGSLTDFGTASSWKFVWLMMGNDGNNSTTIFDMCIPTHTGYGKLQIAGNAGGVWGPEFSTWWDWTGLNQVSFWISKSKTSAQANVGNAYWRTINKAKGLVERNFNETALQKSAEIVFDRVKIPGWFRVSNDDMFNAVYDNIYVASGPNARARIEITDKSTPEASSFVMVIPPLSWNDNRISFRVPAVVAKAREEFFVRIYTADGGKSDKAMRICLNCPRPPVIE